MKETSNIADIKIFNTRHTLVSVWDKNDNLVFVGHVIKKLKNSMALLGMCSETVVEKKRLFGNKQEFTYTWE